MRKNLNLEELKKSEWIEILKKLFNENLLSLFVHGNSLHEGFSPLETPWTVSLILQNTNIMQVMSLQKISAKALRHNIHLKYIFALKELPNAVQKFPLEFFHIANKNEVLYGQKPLRNFAPDNNLLLAECKRELLGALIRFNHTLLHEKTERAYANFKSEILPILYGFHYLKFNAYPQNNQELNLWCDIPETAKNTEILNDFISKLKLLL